MLQCKSGFTEQGRLANTVFLYLFFIYTGIQFIITYLILFINFFYGDVPAVNIIQ